MIKKLTPRDKYLRKTYNITEAEYNKQLQKQGGVCKICGHPPGKRALHVDHDHKVERLKIVYHKYNGEWIAVSFPNNIGTIKCNGQHRLKSQARAQVKAHLKRASVRGLICWPCNKTLQIFRDNPDRFKNAGKYLENYYDWLEGDATRDGFIDE